jgi:hypothetical protein
MIVTQLQWGECERWSNYDFEQLSDKVLEKTGVTLSVSTLKRIFGRVSYSSVPSLTTLNTLSQFTGYTDWRTFMNSLTHTAADSPQPTAIIEETVVQETVVPEKKNNFSFAKVALPVLALLLVGFITINFFSRKTKHSASNFTFSSKTMLTEGLPNSVVFDYDASAASDKDSVFIAQNWDTRRKTLVNKNDKHHSSIYYYPGYFRAKLMIGNDILREHDIQIKTDGWLGLIEADWGKEPLYFKKEEITRGNEIVIDKELVKKYNTALLPVAPPVRLYNQQDIRDIKTDNFIFETELKSDFSDGANACQRVEVLLQSKNDILIVPLVDSACVGDIYLASYGYYTDSRKDDLSGFGCNLHEWTKLKIVCKDRHILFFINDKEAYAADIKNPATEIVGMQYRFNGVGAVRNTRLIGEANKVVVF